MIIGFWLGVVAVYTVSFLAFLVFFALVSGGER